MEQKEGKEEREKLIEREKKKKKKKNSSCTIDDSFIPFHSRAWIHTLKIIILISLSFE